MSGLQVTDRNGRIVYTNRTFTDLLGLSANEHLIGQLPPYSYWPKGDAGFRLMELFDTIKRGQMTTTSYEFHPLRPDGSTFSAFIHISPMITVEGTHLGWLWTLTDISEIRQAQERVTAAHERFTRVLESMQDAISVVDPQTNVLLFPILSTILSSEKPVKVIFKHTWNSLIKWVKRKLKRLRIYLPIFT